MNKHTPCGPTSPGKPWRPSGPGGPWIPLSPFTPVTPWTPEGENGIRQTGHRYGSVTASCFGQQNNPWTWLSIISRISIWFNRSLGSLKSCCTLSPLRTRRPLRPSYSISACLTWGTNEVNLLLMDGYQIYLFLDCFLICTPRSNLSNYSWFPTVPWLSQKSRWTYITCYTCNTEDIYTTMRSVTS